MTIEGKNVIYQQTPLIQANSLDSKLLCVKSLLFKLDNLQPGFSFKIRGISNAVEQALLKNPSITTLVSSSGGNAGLAACIAADHFNLPITVFVPITTSEMARNILKSHGATVKVIGNEWDVAHQAAIKFIDTLPATNNQGFLVHPFEGFDTWNGHATLVKEIFDKIVPDVIICSVGGGGLLCGILTGLLNMKPVPNTIVVAVETSGAASFASSLAAKSLQTLNSITSIAKSLGARTVSQGTLDLSEKYGLEKVRSLVVSDKQALQGVKLFADNYRFLVEPACGASLAPVLEHGSGLLKTVVPELTENSTVVVEVCGGFQVTLDMINAWNSVV